LAQRLRTWFLRNVLDAVERLHGSAAVAQIGARLPERLRPHVSLDRLRASAVLDAIPLDDGEEVLLQIESTLGDGSGRVLENLGLELCSRALGQAGSVVKRGDLFGTVARLQAFFEHPFDGVALTFDLTRTEGGFKLTLGVAGRSRATKVLRSVAAGAVQAAERFARETTSGEITVVAESIADRAIITARYQGRDFTPNDDVPISKRRSSARPPGVSSGAAPSLSEQVEKILGGAGVTGERRPSGLLRRPSDSALQAALGGAESGRPSLSPRGPDLARVEPDPERDASAPPSSPPSAGRKV
jgi:hypothetical protein